MIVSDRCFEKSMMQSILKCKMAKHAPYTHILKMKHVNSRIFFVSRNILPSSFTKDVAPRALRVMMGDLQNSTKIMHISIKLDLNFIHDSTQIFL